ncbi:MAG: hypothetical protein ACXWT1_08305 [Methylobacter sp.]
MNPLQWLVPWETSYAIAIVTAVTAMLFIRGGLRCKLSFRQKLYFWIGLLSLYAAPIPKSIIMPNMNFSFIILWTQGAMMSVIGILIVIHKEFRQPQLTKNAAG